MVKSQMRERERELLASDDRKEVEDVLYEAAPIEHCADCTTRIAIVVLTTKCCGFDDRPTLVALRELILRPLVHVYSLLLHEAYLLP